MAIYLECVANVDHNGSHLLYTRAIGYILYLHLCIHLFVIRVNIANGRWRGRGRGRGPGRAAAAAVHASQSAGSLELPVCGLLRLLAPPPTSPKKVVIIYSSNYIITPG